MNTEAQRHIDKAVGYFEKGEGFYRKAAEEIIAAKKADSTLSNEEIGKRFGKSRYWVERLVTWATTGDRDPDIGPFGGEVRQGRRETSTAKKVMREKPAIVAELTPAEQRALARELDQESAKRQKDRKQTAARKEREHLGDETVTDLAFAETLKSTEYLLIKARGNIAGFVRDAQEFGVETAPEEWRESCLAWVNDLKATLGMAEALLSGGEVDDAAINEWLSREV